MIYQGWKLSFPAFFFAAQRRTHCRRSLHEKMGICFKKCVCPEPAPFRQLGPDGVCRIRSRYEALISDVAAMAPMTQLAAMIVMRRGVFAPLRMSRSRASDLQPM